MKRLITCLLLFVMLAGCITTGIHVQADTIDDTTVSDAIEAQTKLHILPKEESDVDIDPALLEKNIFVGADLSTLDTSEEVPFPTDYPNTWVNTGNQARDIVEIARTQLDYHELKTYSNHTKYNYWFYGEDKYAAWCGIFTCWCAHEAGVPVEVVPWNNTSMAATRYLADWFKKNAVFDGSFETVPQPGDFLFFYNNNYSDGKVHHAAIVTDYNPETNEVTYIGGNQRMADGNYGVTERTGVWAADTRLGELTFAGYGRPYYTNTEPEYVFDSWNWMDEYSFATANFKNVNDPEDVIEVAADVTRTPDQNQMICTASAVFNDQVYTDTVTFDFAKLIVRSLNLEGKITINIKVSLPESIVTDPEAYGMLVFKGNSTKEYVQDLKSQTIDGSKAFVFTQDVCAKEMRDIVKLEIYNGEGKLIPFLGKDYESITSTGCLFSVQDYLNLAKETGDEKLAELAVVMEGYGDAAQLFFQYNADNIEKQESIEAVTLDDLSGEEGEYEGELPEGIFKNVAALVLEADNTIKQYFELAEGAEINHYTFYVDGLEQTPVKNSDGRYYIQVNNVVAKELHEKHIFEVHVGEQTYAIRYSALSYAYKALTVSDDENLKYLVKAIFAYNQAARAFFNY